MKKRIPTLLALGLLLIALFFGVVLLYLQKQKEIKETPLFLPQDLKTVNLDSTQVTFTWQTNLAATGEIIYGTSPLLLNKVFKDDRDNQDSKNHLIHFITLKNLSPETTYYYKIRSGPYLFFDKALSFKTLKPLPKTSSQNPPLRGTVLDQDKPVDEALVLLKVDGAQEFASYTTTAGNFLLPLFNLRDTSFTDYFSFPKGQKAQLEVYRKDKKSIVNLKLPLNQSLPPITLGRNLDFEEIPASQSATSQSFSRFDLNKDGKVNAVDLLIVIESSVNQPDNPQTDFNNDKTVNQEDIDLIENAISE